MRLANYLARCARSCSRSRTRAASTHPALVPLDTLEIVAERFGSAPLREVFGYEPGWACPPPARRAEIER